MFPPKNESVPNSQSFRSMNLKLFRPIESITRINKIRYEKIDEKLSSVLSRFFSRACTSQAGDPVEKKKKTCVVSWIRRPSGDWSDECGWEYLYAQDTLTSRMGVANVTRPSDACNDWSDERGVAICTFYSCSHYGGPPCHSRHGSPVPSRRYH